MGFQVIGIPGNWTVEAVGNVSPEEENQNAAAERIKLQFWTSCSSFLHVSLGGASSKMADSKENLFRDQASNSGLDK